MPQYGTVKRGPSSGISRYRRSNEKVNQPFSSRLEISECVILSIGVVAMVNELLRWPISRTCSKEPV